MPTPQTLTETDVLAISDAAGDPGWLRERRLEAFKAFADIEWPTVRDEEWRFTNPKRIPLDRPHAKHGGGITSTGKVVVSDLSAAASAHADVVREHLGTVVPPEEKFAALALAAFDQGHFVHVPASATGVRVDLRIEASGGTHVRWTLIVLERHAEATVVLEQRGEAESTVIDVVEVVVGDGATLNLVTQQRWGDGVAHVTTHRAKLSRDASYQHTEVTLGGHTVYVRPDVWLYGKGSSAEMLGVYFPTGSEKFEHRSLILHEGDHSTSDYVHKGALSDEAHATWYGNIRIHPDAKQTVSDETNRNLILSPGARADTLPFLEIETADVAACGHHSSVGQVDEVQLWYLQSRGIPRDEAARMLVFAFFTDVLDRVKVEGVEETVLADIEDAIRAAPATLMDPRRSASARHAAAVATREAADRGIE